MKISKKQLRKQIEKAYEEGKEWIKVDRRHCFLIRIDTDDTRVWCDTYLDSNSYSVYSSPSIQIVSGIGWYDEDVIDDMLNNAIKLLEESGWRVENE